MNNRDKTLLQKLKDNAFYLSLGLGLFAVLAVVGVYTAQQNDMKIAENEMDLNVASNYTDITEKDMEETNDKVTKQDVKETNGKVAKQDVDVTNGDVTKEEEDIAVTNGEVTKQDVDEISEEESKKSEESTEANVDDLEQMDLDENAGESIPTTVEAGELDFNSEKTITWPVNGQVLIPYSMETTVHFKTLDQYQCNPGMMIQAGVGTTVQNAYLGQVTNVTSDNTYGNLVTLYIGNDYSITYGQLDTIYAKEGDFVKAGQSIGTVGKPTDSFTEEGSHLFFQMSCGDETVDPMLYIEQISVYQNVVSLIDNM